MYAECTPSCINPETNTAISPGEVVLSMFPCISYTCPSGTPETECGEVIVDDESNACISVTELGCGDSKIPKYNESNECCPIECICPENDTTTCASPFHVKKYTTGECPTSYCECECSDIPQECQNTPGCKTEITEYSLDECHCPISYTCIPSTDTCSNPPVCDPCLYAAVIGTDVGQNLCETNCTIYQCTRVNCTNIPEPPESCDVYKHFVSTYGTNDSDQCCPITDCECLPEEELMHICSQWNKTCRNNFTLHEIENSGCCPEYTCECDYAVCPPPVVCEWGHLWSSLPTVISGGHNDVCCNTTVCTCVNVSCIPPPLECPEYHNIAVDNTTNPCCPIFKCECDALTYPDKVSNPIYKPDVDTNTCNHVPGQNIVPIVDPSGCFATCECLPSNETDDLCPDSIVIKATCNSPRVANTLPKPTDDPQYTCCDKIECKCPDCGPGYVTKAEIEANLREDQKVVHLNPGDECCKNYSAICKDKEENKNICAEYDVTCGENYIKSRNTSDVGCCGAYHCICNVSSCPSVPECTAPKIPGYDRHDGCCVIYECVCPVDPNDNITCEPPLIRDTKYNNSCLSNLCRCPNEDECPKEATANCTNKIGCRPVVTERDGCGCTVNSTCVTDPSPCPLPITCPKCYQINEVDTYTIVDECNSTCKNYNCTHIDCPTQPTIPTLCAWNTVTTNFTHDGCCSIDTPICLPQNCPYEPCPPGYHEHPTPGEYIDGDSCPDLKCCENKTCVCDFCFLDEISYKIGDVLNDNDTDPCSLIECKSERGADGCYVFETYVPSCEFKTPDGKIVTIGVDAFYEDPEDKCSRLKCIQTVKDDNCEFNLVPEKEPCVEDIECPEFMDALPEENSTECCQNFTCICKPCGNDYVSGLNASLEDYEELYYMPYDENKNQMCCPRAIKQCVNNTMLSTLCPQWNFGCPTTAKRIPTNHPDECCPEYKCECIENICPRNPPVEYNNECQEEMNKTLEENPDQLCCPQTKIVCKTEVSCCVNKTCDEDEILTTDESNDPTTGYCCPIQNCVCKDECSPGWQSYEYLESILQIGEIILPKTPDKKCCPIYEIVCKADRELIIDCKNYNTTCNPGESRYPTTKIGCCQQYECVCDTCEYQGNFYTLYDKWIDPNNPCALQECTDTRLLNGCYKVASSGECSHNNYSYPVGSELTTNDPCRTLICEESNGEHGCTHQFVEVNQTCNNTFQCEQYEVVKEVYTLSHCCPALSCECEPCGPDYPGSGVDREPEEYETIVPLSILENPNYICCPRSKIICKNLYELRNICDQFYMTSADCLSWQMLNRTSSDQDCCPQYECVCRECPEFPVLRDLFKCEEYYDLPQEQNYIAHCCPRKAIRCAPAETCCEVV